MQRNTDRSKTTAEVPPSEPQEIPFLPRREGTAWSAHEIDRAVRDARDLLRDGDADAGRRIWRIGDKVVELYNGFPERVMGHPTFIGFACEVFDRSREDIHEVLRARRRVKDADVAAKLGRVRMQLGFRLLDRLGIETFETLAERDLPLPDGSTCRFPATVRQLRAALAFLATTPPGKSSRRLLSHAARCNEALKIAKQEEPDLADVRARFVARDDDVFLETTALSSAQRVALARLILKLEKDA
jgi:hypothetical protein